jgi:hypothetical protein
VHRAALAQLRERRPRVAEGRGVVRIEGGRGAAARAAAVAAAHRAPEQPPACPAPGGRRRRVSARHGDDVDPRADRPRGLSKGFRETGLRADLDRGDAAAVERGGGGLAQEVRTLDHPRPEPRVEACVGPCVARTGRKEARALDRPRSDVAQIALEPVQDPRSAAGVVRVRRRRLLDDRQPRPDVRPRGIRVARGAEQHRRARARGAEEVEVDGCGLGERLRLVRGGRDPEEHAVLAVDVHDPGHGAHDGDGVLEREAPRRVSRHHLAEAHAEDGVGLDARLTPQLELPELHEPEQDDLVALRRRGDTGLESGQRVVPGPLGDERGASAHHVAERRLVHVEIARHARPGAGAADEHEDEPVRLASWKEPGRAAHQTIEAGTAAGYP